MSGTFEFFFPLRVIIAGRFVAFYDAAREIVVSVALRLPNRERGLLSSVPHFVARGCRLQTAFSNLIVSPWRWRDKMSDDGSAICCQLSPDALITMC